MSDGKKTVERRVNPLVVRPVKPPRRMKSICVFAGATGFESRGTTEHWEYKQGISDYANNRQYGGDSRKGQSRIDYDHGWLDGKELRDSIDEHNTRIWGTSHETTRA